jgi:hypothetical protein
MNAASVSFATRSKGSQRAAVGAGDRTTHLANCSSWTSGFHGTGMLTFYRLSSACQEVCWSVPNSNPFGDEVSGNEDASIVVALGALWAGSCVAHPRVHMRLTSKLQHIWRGDRGDHGGVATCAAQCKYNHPQTR